MLSYINNEFNEINYSDLYNIIKSIGDLPIVIKRRFRKPSVKYYDVECGFDIETTSTYVDNNKAAWMYEWTFGLKDVIIIGRTWDELRRLMEIISNVYDEAKLVVYVHNLSFEFQFLCSEFPMEDVFASDARTVLYCTTSNYEFRDSYILSGYSLAKVADNLVSHSIKKLKGDLDYSLIRTSDTTMTNEELMYCVNDVLIILYYINEQIAEFGHITKIPMTNTGRVREYCKNATLFTTNSKGKKCRNHRYLDLIRKEEMTDNLYKLSRLAFRGGFTHAGILHSMIKLDNVGSYDLTSAYPSVMVKNKYPVGAPEEFESLTNSQFEYSCSKYAVLSVIKIHHLRMKSDVYDSYISWIPSKMVAGKLGQLNNGRITEAWDLQMVITEVDWSIIKDCYNIDGYEVFNTYVWTLDYLPVDLVKCVLHFYELKTTLKGVKGKEQEYQNGKGKLNSTYGMMVQDPLKDINEYENGTWKCKKLNLSEAIEQYNKSQSRFTYYVQGLWITAYCRRTIWDAILAVGEDYVYTDTDSVKMLNPEQYTEWFNQYNLKIIEEVKAAMNHYNLPIELACPQTIKGTTKWIGLFDFEGIYDNFKTLGAKRYMTYKNGEYELTCSGVTKGAIKYIVDNGGFDFFNMDMVIPGEYTGKMSHTYIDIPFSDVIMDYQGHQTYVVSNSAVHLEPARYAINPDEDWLDWLFKIDKSL